MKSKTVFTILGLLGFFIISSNMELKAQVEGIVIEPDVRMERGEVYSTGRADRFFGISTGISQGERNSRLMLSKKYSGQTVEKTGTFQIEESITQLRLSVHGNVVSGSISVSLVLPDGKPFKQVTIDETANVYWSETINIKESVKRYYGDWKYTISTKSADGQYSLSINSL